MNDSWERDPSYLFRMCSDYAWDETLAACAALTRGIEAAVAPSTEGSDVPPQNPTFVDNIGMKWRVWHECRQRTLDEWLRLADIQLHFTDPYGNRPLHAACYNKPPTEVVVRGLFGLGRLVREHGSEGDDPAFADRCSDGSTPLLVACSTGASTGVVHCILDEVDHYVERGWAHERTVRKIVIQTDQQGFHPLQGLFSFHESFIKRHALEMREEDDRRGRLSYREQYSATETLADYWTVALRMLQFCTMHIHPHDNQSTAVLVHRCAAIAPHCPPLLLEWVTMPHVEDTTWMPAEDCAASPDSGGRLPLHRALDANGGDFSPKLEENRMRITRTLLKWCPRAAAVPFPSGKSPFVHAVARGFAWHPPRSSSSDIGSDSQDRECGMLRLLWNHAPGALLEVDETSGLYPFMIAAATNLGESLDVVDTIYNLLRHAPEALQG